MWQSQFEAFGPSCVVLSVGHHGEVIYICLRFAAFSCHMGSLNFSLG